ncbi:MAG: helix-turn-helix domain-containing protein [Candidatus Gastranaerophilaceae bacterium]
MNKLHLLKQAENLYCIENLTPDIIAEKLNISRRTVFNWIKKYNWKSNPVRIKDFPKQFSGEFYSLGAKLSKKMIDDLDNNRVFNKHTVCALGEVLKIINKFEKNNVTPINNIAAKSKSEQTFSPDFISTINKNILGWNGTF